jgi:hypothetical protein
VDTQNVYWVNFTMGGAVMKVPVAGGTPTSLVTVDYYPTALALDETYVYFVVQNDDFHTTAGTVQRVPIAGGPAVIIASGLSYPEAIAVDADNVYWTTQGSDQGVYVLPKTTVGATTAPVLSSSNGVNTGAMAQDTLAIYWGAGATVFGAAKSQTNATPENVASDSGGVRSLVVIGDELYMADQASVGVQPLVSDGIPVNIVNSLIGCSGLTADDTHVYYGAQSPMLHIGIAPVGGNASDAVFAISPQIPIALTSDAANVYWVTMGPNGGVYKVPKHS